MKKLNEIRFNTITKTNQNGYFDDQYYIEKGFKYIFSIGYYNVYMYPHNKNTFLRIQVESENNDDLCIAEFNFDKINGGLPIFEVSDANVKKEYQGLGIAPRLYEGMINHFPNFCLLGHDQSSGAYKSWIRLSKFNTIKIYSIISQKYEKLPITIDFLNSIIEEIDITDKKKYTEAGYIIALKKNSGVDKLFKKIIEQKKSIDLLQKTTTNIFYTRR